MKYSIRFSDAIHIMAYIEIFQGTNLSSEMIGKSVETNPANVRKLMGLLRNAGLIKTQAGKAAPSLAKPADQISFFDIYRAIEGDNQLLHVDETTNPNCVIGANIQDVLNEKYSFLQKQVENEMKQITLAEVIGDISQLESKRRPENKELVARFL